MRGYVSINVQSGEAMDTHSFATLIGVGATTVNPYLAFDSLYQRHEKKLFGKFSFDECVERYIKSVNAGLLKIMSKMGITLKSRTADAENGHGPDRPALVYRWGAPAGPEST